MKTLVTYHCGHQVVEDTFGGQARDRYLKAATYRVCPTCQRAADLARAEAATSDLDALTGSEKQIVWATTIRAAKLEQFDEFVAGRTVRNTPEQIAQVRALLTAQTSAAWWIDHRDMSAQSIGRELAIASMEVK